MEFRSTYSTFVLPHSMDPNWWHVISPLLESSQTVRTLAKICLVSFSLHTEHTVDGGTTRPKRVLTQPSFWVYLLLRVELQSWSIQQPFPRACSRHILASDCTTSSIAHSKPRHFPDVITVMVMAYGDFPAVELAPSIRDCNGITIHQIDGSVTHQKMDLIREAAAAQLERNDFDFGVFNHDISED